MVGSLRITHNREAGLLGNRGIGYSTEGREKNEIAFTATTPPKKLSIHTFIDFVPLTSWEGFSLYSLSFDPFQLH